MKNLSAHKNDTINKNDFKYFLANKAVLLNDNNIDSIFAVYHINKRDFIQFLNSINQVSETRKAQIESFKDQVKAPG